MAVFTLEDEQIVWTDKSSDVKTERTNFLMNKLSDTWLSGKMIFPTQFVCRDEQVDITLRHKFTSDRQMPDDLSV